MFKNHEVKFRKLADKKNAKITGAGKIAKNRGAGFKNLASRSRNLVPYLPILGVSGIAVFATMQLRALPSVADTSVDASIKVVASCSLTGVIDEAHEAEVINGQYVSEVGTTTLTTHCNDANGYEIYAVGYSNDEEGNTNLVEQVAEGATDAPNTIATGLFPGVDEVLNTTPSSWSMKLTAISGAHTPLIQNGFEKYHVIPASSTLVASYAAGTSGAYMTDSSMTTTYDVFANQTQAAGTYQGKVKYTMVQSAALYRQYIQDLTLNDCKRHVGEGGNAANVGDTIEVRDIRDGNDYTVRYINGGCWMTQNLRFTGTEIEPATTNINAKKTMTYYEAVGSEGTSSSGHCWMDMNYPTIAGGGYTYACMHDSGSEETGVYYNFAAATAGTITGTNNSGSATYSLCPAGWHLPSGPGYTSGTDYYMLSQGIRSGTNDYLEAFNGVYGGYIWNGAINYTNWGSWWTGAPISVNSISSGRETVLYVSGSFRFANDSRERSRARFLRCVRTS